MFFEVPRFHTGGETVHANGFHEEWGGKGFNQAVAASRQGAEVAFLGATSMSDSKPLTDFCNKEGLHATIAAKPEPTACAAIMTDGTGETRVTVPDFSTNPYNIEKYSTLAGISISFCLRQ